MCYVYTVLVVTYAQAYFYANGCKIWSPRCKKWTFFSQLCLWIKVILLLLALHNPSLSCLVRHPYMLKRDLHKKEHKPTGQSRNLMGIKSCFLQVQFSHSLCYFGASDLGEKTRLRVKILLRNIFTDWGRPINHQRPSLGYRCAYMYVGWVLT